MLGTSTIVEEALLHTSPTCSFICHWPRWNTPQFHTPMIICSGGSLGHPTKNCEFGPQVPLHRRVESEQVVRL
jgi:hypothetical protein